MGDRIMSPSDEDTREHEAMNWTRAASADQVRSADAVTSRHASSRSRSKTTLVGAAVFFGFVALAGVITAYAAVKDFAFARASGAWPQAHGVILSAPGNNSRALRYVYYVDGESYEGRRLAFLTRGYIGAPPPRTPGSKVPVYVNPVEPATSVLVPGGSGRRFAFWLLIGGGAVFVGVAGLTRTMMAIDFPEYDIRARGDANDDGVTDAALMS